MIIQQIKKKIYQILSDDLSYTVKDNPFNIEEKEIENYFPDIRINLSYCQRERYKQVFINRIKFQIDIFSDYNGEKEILEIEEKIFNKMQQLYDIPGMIYIQESDFRILNDKSLGYVLKHGVISYTFYTGGEEKIVEEEVEDEQTSPTP